MRFGVLAAVIVPGMLAAQNAAPPDSTKTVKDKYGHTIPVPTAIAARRDGPILLDAKLDEPAWKAATAITQFTQLDPEEGKPPSQKSEVRFLFDDEALYIGGKFYDTAGAKGVTTRLVRRDAQFDSDYLQIVIDGYHDHLSRAFFEVNPSGSIADRIGIGEGCCDSGWDPIWEAVTHIDPDGWTAEIRIPYSQLRFSRDSVQVWGLEVRRFIKRRDEEDDWSFWHKNEAGGPSRFGHLEGLRIGRATKGLELMPYLSAKSQSLVATAGGPFDTDLRPSFRGGLDLRDRLTSNRTLNATINPDFGQVEVDPAVINLSAFETFFPEKRPFFVEGSQVFDFGSFGCNFCSNVEGMSAFYSRRVGRSPTGASLAFNNYADANIPDATTILGAGKLTGRTASGYTIGLLDALTAKARADVVTSTGARAKQDVEPLANYYVARVKKDMRQGNLIIGGVLSGVRRSIDTTFAPRLADHAEMAGLDMVASTHDKKYSFRSSAAYTDLHGDPRVILARQQSSARYFQRPGRSKPWSPFADTLDPTLTALHGLGAYARAAKETGDWFGETSVNLRTPGYETNDFAFQRQADYIWNNVNFGRFFSKKTSWYQTMVAITGAQQQRNWEGDRTGLQYHEFWNVTTPNFWNFTEFFIERPRTMDERQLRGGPIVENAASHFALLEVTSNSRHAFVADVTGTYYWDEMGGWSPSIAVQATYRPAPNVSVSFGPSFSPGVTSAQYVEPVTDPTATAFAGTRHVLAKLFQKGLFLDTRVSWTFTPRMTLEAYVQPLFASGHYYGFEEYAAPRTNRVLEYGKDIGTISSTVNNGVVSSYTIDPDGAGPAQQFTIQNPDFTDVSLRGNTVFRWEYRPGSVLYVAWTQSRFDESAFGDFRFSRERDALRRTRPDNIFLVKASWWLPM